MTISRFLSSAIVGLIIVGPACSAKFIPIGDDDAGTGVKCSYNNVTYAPGATFPSADGCNTCGCGNDGSVACTLMYCGGVGGASGLGGGSSVAGSCFYNGAYYATGSSFKSSDGCNTCGCTSDGQVACTEMYCGGVGGSSSAGGNGGVAGGSGASCLYNGVTYPAGSSIKSPDGCNTCACVNGAFGCTTQYCGGVGGASAAGGGSSVAGASGGSCLYNGVNYPYGLRFKSTDGCNSCSCSYSGIACTDMSCAPVGGASGMGGSSSVTCTYEGVTYGLGALVKSVDGCNTCTCGNEGLMLCTEMGCAAAGGTSGVGGASSVNSCLYNGIRMAPGTSFHATDGCNTCYCDATTGAVGCTKMACATGGSTSVGPCPTINLSLPYCGSAATAVAKIDPTTGCVVGYACPASCPTKNVSPTCPNYQFITDATTGCSTGYICVPGAAACPPVATPICGSGTEVVAYDASGCVRLGCG